MLDVVCAIDPMVGFKVYNVLVVWGVCTIIGWRTQRWSTIWLLFPLLVMADSDVSFFANNWWLVGSAMPAWRAVFTSDLVYNIGVSVVVTASCVVLYRKCGKKEAC